MTGGFRISGRLQKQFMNSASVDGSTIMSTFPGFIHIFRKMQIGRADVVMHECQDSTYSDQTVLFHMNGNLADRRLYGKYLPYVSIQQSLRIS